MKNIQEIREAFAAATNGGINLELFFGIGEMGARVYKKADISDAATKTICPTYIQSVSSIISDEDLTTRELSKIDSRGNVLWFYDLNPIPADLSAAGLLLSETGDDYFSFKEHSVADVKSILVRLSSPTRRVILYKSVYPVSIIKRDQFMLYPLDLRLEIVDKDLLKLTHGFDVLCVDDEFYINNFKTFEKSFGFDDIARNTMQRVSNNIIASNLVVDTKGYIASLMIPKRESIRADSSKVLGLPPATIIAFAQAKAQKIGLVIKDDKIQITSKEGVNKLFKLLNDDYLTSELTHRDYESQAKDEL